MLFVSRKIYGLVVLPMTRGMTKLQRHVLSANLALYPTSPLTVKKQKHGWQAEIEEPRPLVLLFEYMKAQRKHISKFVEYYRGRNFDVLTANLAPWQLLFPVRGSQVLAREIAEFLLANEKFNPLVYHGFSVGGYLWGEMMKICRDDNPRYLPVTDRVRGIILDSGVDVMEIPTAFPRAVLPNKPHLWNILETVIKWQMEIFFDQSTRHYIAAREAFTQGIVDAPWLFLYSESDPLSTYEINKKAANEVEATNQTAQINKFNGSKHVMHYKKYPVEYLDIVTNFLKELDLRPRPPLQTVPVEQTIHLQAKL